MSVETVSPAKTEWKSFQEIRKTIEANPVYGPFSRLVSLYIYTCAHKGVRGGTEAFIQDLQLRQDAVSTKDTLLLQNAHEIIDCYSRICLDLNEQVRQHWLAWHAMDDSSSGVKTELGTAISKYLMQTGSFSFQDLISYMERHYSEKKLLKYVGPIPLYKDVLMFTREAIQKKLSEYIERGMVIPAIPSAPSKEKKRGEAEAIDQSERFISIPYCYTIFYWQWDPTLLNLSLEEDLRELERVMQEILGCQLNNLQSTKVVRLIFKDCETNFERVLLNYAKIVSLYFKQLNEPAPNFLENTPEGVMLRLGASRAAGKPSAKQSALAGKPGPIHGQDPRMR